MPIYKAPVEDVTFLLNDVFQIDRYDNLPGFTDASADVREAILGEAAKLSEEVLQPLNRVGDLEGCKRNDDASVTTPKGFKEAFKQVSEGGWLGLSAPAEYGGQGLPVTLSQVVTEFQSAANMAFSMYGGLTMGATAALLVHGKPEQKKMFVPKMVAGEWRSANGAVLEFENEIEGIKINGVDIITFSDDGKITHFKVMVRPLKGINLLHRLMGEQLAKG
jgi:hypothetical protein